MNSKLGIFENHTNPKRFGALDGLRGIAVLIVFMSHTSGREMSIHNLLQFHGIGHVGVYLFFCLSAYLLVSKLLATELKRRDIKNFFIKRIFRIWPLYFIVITLVFILQLITGEVDQKYLHINNGITGFLLHIFFYQGDSVFWSVIVEEQFYVICPFIVVGLRKFIKIVFWILLVIILVNFILYISHHIGVPFKSDYIKYFTTNNRGVGNYLDIFFFCSISTYFSYKHENFLEKNKRVFFIISNILFFSIMLATLVLVSHNFLGFSQPFYKFRYLSLIYAICFMPLVISISYGNRINKYFDNLLLRKIGLYGFSIYLIHMFVFQIVNSYVDYSGYVKFIIASVSTFLLSYLTYTFIEKVFVNISYSLISKSKIENKL